MSVLKYKADDVIQKMAQLFSKTNIFQLNENKNLEYEVESSLDSLNKYAEINKYPQLDKETFYKILEYVKSTSNFQCLSKNKIAEHSTDYYYPNNIRRRVTLKDNVKEDKLADSNNFHEEWIQKKSITSIDLRSLEKRIGIRYRIKTEEKIKPLPKQTPISSIRSKQTLLFYNPLNAMNISFSVIFKGSTESETLASSPSFEIEVEVNMNEFLKLNKLSDESIELHKHLSGLLTYQILDLFDGFNLHQPDYSLQFI